MREFSRSIHHWENNLFLYFISLSFSLSLCIIFSKSLSPCFPPSPSFRLAPSLTEKKNPRLPCLAVSAQCICKIGPPCFLTHAMYVYKWVCVSVFVSACMWGPVLTYTSNSIPSQAGQWPMSSSCRYKYGLCASHNLTTCAGHVVQTWSTNTMISHSDKALTLLSIRAHTLSAGC